MADPYADIAGPQGAEDPYAAIATPVDTPRSPRVVGAAMSVNNPPLVAPGPRTTQQPTPPKPWGDVAGEAVLNLPASAGHFVNALAQPFLHPIDTTNALGDVGLGIVSKGRALAQRAMGIPNDVDRATVEAPANAVGQFFADRYGGVENVKNTLATDPVGALADASLVLSGGALLPGKIGQIVGAASRAIDPVTQSLNAVKATGRGAEALTSNALGMTTGTGKETVRAAARAGREGGEAAEAFTRNMRGSVPIEDVVNTAKAAVDQVRKERADAYKAGMTKVGEDKTVLDFGPIDEALNKANQVGTYKGKVVNRSAGETMDRVSALVNEWKALDPKEFHTPEGLDALKRTLGDLRDATEQGTPARVAADRVYNAVKGEIAKQAPEYARTMEAYAQASDNLKEVTKTLSLGEKATGDTAGRKLLSATRNNAQTNYGQRISLIDQLAQYEPTLPYMIAGQGMNALAPRGLVGRGGAMAAGGAMIAHPTNIMLLPAFSPRVVGEGAYYAGRGAGMADNALNLLRINEANVRRGGRAAYQSGRAREEQR